MLGVVTEGKGPKEGWVTMVKTQSLYQLLSLHHGGALVETAWLDENWMVGQTVEEVNELWETRRCAGWWREVA